ncbi:hypothetical protein PFAG_05564 [Plasmodium falciparum Santa Lucia]|uniref:Inner membrane complex protein, putative n=13 Tax=Plasmodium falciparum TaxID=5833 RepID=Q8IKZ9_PLAF7|nr:inner membrane complex protein, putative [Plasmodium falciparum 3D7]ETW15996.1 hypothetical protein PFFVO_05098 [Plasmodium falciparum Vietnam Oak-Knoll (FVO)]ETW27188.1 hypothetical protein PFFCH_05366 [Plasmodium falciparum FCH/4]ETW33822.1 hypothetical protein PFTANZ_05451 [Plasmodium falciparum Tanzania (2000708)]ETW39790.1 hypothetical protein PFNF135_05819 [Plasmodium falciparum NF135/5.C10]ETW46667.1 hypothetical protein PFMALIP_05303 [Plasmodium falciparum MaliPS096_E11]ETW54130.1 |eukprot:XP_001348626.2 inner membrane complex protein, putative [Plasmodium falciparum 3D7]
MNLFKKSTCSACNSCNCCCERDEVKITERTYTYNDLDNLYDNEGSSSFPYIPTERIILNSYNNPDLYYHQIDTEFYTKNILYDVPLVSYAQGPYYERIPDMKLNEKYRLPTLSYVSDPVYIRRREKCTISNFPRTMCWAKCRSS